MRLPSPPPGPALEMPAHHGALVPGVIPPQGPGMQVFPNTSEKAKNAAERLKELEDRGRAVLQNYRT